VSANTCNRRIRASPGVAIAGISSEVHCDPIDANEFRPFPFRADALISGFFEDII